MNWKIVINILGKILLSLAVLMLIPLAVAFIYHEDIKNILAFSVPILICFIAGILMIFKRVDSQGFGSKDGFFITGVSWFLMSIIGCLPFIISQEIPDFFSAFFEITSGFTTTGASALTADQLDALSHSMLFWRSFSHWIGGMGILVFVFALGSRNQENSMHILRAEAPGPQVGKFVSRMSKNSRILYYIYILITLLLVGSLMLARDPQIGIFEAFCYAFATAGTGGFAVTSAGLGIYNPAVQYILASFMVIFGINFTLFYLMIIRNFKAVFKNEEIRWYITTLVVAIIVVFANTLHIYSTVEETFRNAFFQVASIMSTTGFTTVDYANTWPALSLGVILILMLVGSCAGSTAGGMKQSRVLLIVKKCIFRLKTIFNPRSVNVIKMDGEIVSDKMMNSVVDFAFLYFVLFVVSAILTSIYNPNLHGYNPISAISASLSCISNIGPGLGVVGPTGTFADFSGFSKIVFAIEMIAGRLELLPVLVLFNPLTYKKRNAF